MATIGTFTRTENGFTGSVKTLTINVKGVRFVPIEEPVENGPVFRVFAGTAEFGAAWKKRSDRGNDFYSVKLDDPSFPKPIYAGLFEAEGEDLVLAWSRRSRPDEND